MQSSDDRQTLPGRPVVSTWQLRWMGLLALVCLVVARLLVRFVPLAVWRSTLGVAVKPADPAVSDQFGVALSVRTAEASQYFPNPVCDQATLRHAMRLGRCVDRAAQWLPGTSKCLPRAAALQWLLRREGIPSALVIAFRLADRAGVDAFHAWTETCGEMLVGQCDRAAYRPIMALYQPRPN